MNSLRVCRNGGEVEDGAADAATLLKLSQCLRDLIRWTQLDWGLAQLPATGEVYDRLEILQRADVRPQYGNSPLRDRRQGQLDIPAMQAHQHIRPSTAKSQVPELKSRRNPYEISNTGQASFSEFGQFGRGLR